MTGRPVGAAPALPALARAGLPIFTLDEFGDAEIDAFIERWHDHAFPDAPDVATKRKQRIRVALRENEPLRELAKTPLLLTLIALLNRGGELPRRRHSIYGEVLELLAERWEANKHERNGVSPLDGLQKKRLLRQVAWRMMNDLPDGAGNLVRETDLLVTVKDFCERDLGEAPERAEATAREIVNELRERNGILVSLGGRLFGFCTRPCSNTSRRPRRWRDSVRTFGRLARFRRCSRDTGTIRHGPRHCC